LNNKRCLAVITARGGSKGLKGKNKRLLLGKPLINWTIAAALESNYVNKVLVSTDDKEIATISEDAGAWVPFVRPSNLSGDQASHIDTVLHAISWVEDKETEVFDYIVLLQPTLPFRTCDDIDESIGLIIERNVSSVIGLTEVDDNPALFKKMSDDLVLENYYNDVIEKDLRRQDCGSVYKINGAIYLCSINFLKSSKSWYGNDSIGHVMPASRSVDIDTEQDLLFAEFLAKNASFD